MENAITIEEWMVNPAVHLPVFEHQDGEWCIASAFLIPKLIDLYHLPNTIAARRDSILYAIAINLEMLLGTDSNGREKIEPHRERILEFAQAEWHNILRINREMGLSGDFETHVLPYMERFKQR